MLLENGLNVSAVVLFGLFLKKAVDTLRFAAGTFRNEPTAASSLLTQAIAFAAGLAAVFLFAGSDFGSAVQIGGVSLDSADTATKVILGLMAASLGSTAADLLKSVDRSQSAAVPRLVRDPKAPPTPVTGATSATGVPVAPRR